MPADPEAQTLRGGAGEIVDLDASLPDLADGANDEHRAAEDAASRALEHARRAGELLVEAKGRVEHGDWTDWIRRRCDFSPRTARRYMRIADRWSEIEARMEGVQNGHAWPIREIDRLLSDSGPDEGADGSGEADPDDGARPEERDGGRSGGRRAGAAGRDAPEQGELLDETPSLAPGDGEPVDGEGTEPARRDEVDVEDAPRSGGPASTLLGRFRRLADFCEEHDPATVAGALEPREAEQLAANATTIDRWVDDLASELDSVEREAGPEPAPGTCRGCGRSIGPAATICGRCRRKAGSEETEGAP